MLSQRGGFYPNTRQETALTFKLQVPSNGDVCIWIEQIYNVNNRFYCLKGVISVANDTLKKALCLSYIMCSLTL